MKRILILGASGTFGKALVEKLSNDEECHLTLASRHASACYHESERCHVVDCDAMKADDLQQAMAGCHVVYCAISGDDLPVIAEKTVSAMKKAGLRDGDKDDFTLTFKGEQAKGLFRPSPPLSGLPFVLYMMTRSMSVKA